ncbi:MAG: hypothetical protein R2856_10485 [Caldilineaceae bacterium]
MSRKLSISFLMALILVMAISVAAMAAGPGPQNPDAGIGINGETLRRIHRCRRRRCVRQLRRPCPCAGWHW